MSPKEFEKITSLSLIKIESFFDELIKDFSVVCFHKRFPLSAEKQFKSLFVSTI